MSPGILRARDRYDAIADEFGKSEPFVRQVCHRLRSDRLIASGRPTLPKMTARELARIILAMASNYQIDASRTVKTLGGLPRSAGDGHGTAEDALTHLVEQAAGDAALGVDFRKGELIVNITSPSLLVSGQRLDGTPFTWTYRRDGDGMRDVINQIIVVPLRTIRTAARRLIGA